jgi:hypothetical protein
MSIHHHDSEILGDPKLHFETPPQNDLFSGADRIAALICLASGSHWVNEYARPIPEPASLESMVAFGKGYIVLLCHK